MLLRKLARLLRVFEVCVRAGGKISVLFEGNCVRSVLAKWEGFAIANTFSGNMGDFHVSPPPAARNSIFLFGGVVKHYFKL